MEGTLKIVGVKWKLSSSVVGFHNFVTSSMKKIQKGRKKNKQSPADNLKFVVVKVHNVPSLASKYNNHENIVMPICIIFTAFHFGRLFAHSKLIVGLLIFDYAR